MQPTLEYLQDNFPFWVKTAELTPGEYVAIVNWCMKNYKGEFSYTFDYGDTFYFKEEEHSTWFILRWSNYL